MSQTQGDVEHISIDGQSTDGTRDILDKYRGHFAFLLSEKDGGIYQAMNKGLALAGGELVGFLNSDDVYASNDILAGIDEFLSRQKLDSCYGDIVYVDRRAPGRVIRTWKSGPYRLGNIEKGWMPPHPAFFARRKIYERWGGFDPRFPVVADYEIMLRFLYRYRISSGYLPRVIVRKQSGGVSRPTLLRVIRNNKACYRAWQANGLRPRPVLFIRKAISKLGQLRLVP
jgi:glycosyltransferase